MSEKCKPKYKNLNLIQSYGDQHYASSRLFEQICQNDEYLRQKYEDLSYLSAPAVRARVKDLPVDSSLSYGYLEKDNEIIFSNNDRLHLSCDFSGESTLIVDDDKTDCEIITDGDFTRAKVPLVPWEDLHESDKYFTGTMHKNGETANSYWHICFDPSKPYYVKKAWIENNKHLGIPAVTRAQTFTIKEGESGLLESVTLLLQNTGEMSYPWTSPLYVQIWPVVEKQYNVTRWDDKKRKSVNVIDPQTNKVKKETIYEPKGNIYKPLAECIFSPDKTIPGWYSFVFNKPLKVNAGEHYAIVMFSPLTHPNHCPRIGGWGRNCTSVKYDGGDAFVSEDNCRTWKRYGRNDKSIPYKFGRYSPQDFAFQCRIRKDTNQRKTGSDFYLYFKPIFSNPITDFTIGGVIRGETQGESDNQNIFLNLEYSIDGREWHNINNGATKYFLDNHPRMLFLRVKMSTNVTDDSPYVENLNVVLNTDPADDMYVRTHYYTPNKLTPMLGASHWGRVYAPFNVSPNENEVKASVEIIENKVLTQNFHIVSVSELYRYLDKEIDGEKILDESQIVGDNITDDDRCEYLINNPSVLSALKNENIYIKPYTLDDVKYYLSFDGGLDSDENQLIAGLKFSNSPASPILSSKIHPLGTEMIEAVGEWYDYIMDYDTDELIFYEKTIDGENNEVDLLEKLPDGILEVDYNPVFIQDLTNFEIGDRIDEETGLPEKGLILDYFKETILINTENVETRRVPLRVVPVDPIRSVIFNKDSENEMELFEDIHYTVDYLSKELVFSIQDDINEKSILTENSTLEIVYTPNLDDVAISIGYRAHRKNVQGQCRIPQTRFVEYKV